MSMFSVQVATKISNLSSLQQWSKSARSQLIKLGVMLYKRNRCMHFGSDVLCGLAYDFGSSSDAVRVDKYRCLCFASN